MRLGWRMERKRQNWRSDAVRMLATARLGLILASMRCYYATRSKVFPFLPLEDDDTAFGGFALSEDFPPVVTLSKYGPAIFDALPVVRHDGSLEIGGSESPDDDPDISESEDAILVLFYHQPIGDVAVIEGDAEIVAFDGDFMLAVMQKRLGNSPRRILGTGMPGRAKRG